MSVYSGPPLDKDGVLYGELGLGTRLDASSARSAAGIVSCTAGTAITKRYQTTMWYSLVSYNTRICLPCIHVRLPNHYLGYQLLQPTNSSNKATNNTRIYPSFTPSTDQPSAVVFTTAPTILRNHPPCLAPLAYITNRVMDLVVLTVVCPS